MSTGRHRTDRFLRACRGEPVDRTPVWFMRQAGRSHPKYRALRDRYSVLDICRNPAMCAEITLQPVDDLGVDAAILFADITLPLGGMGVAFDLKEGVGPQIDQPVRTADALARLRPFEIDTTIASVLEAVRLIRKDSPVPCIGFAGGPFTLASYLIEGGPSRDFVHTKTVMYQDPRLWHRIMELLTDATIRYLGAQVEAGVHAVQLFDSWIGCLTPADYRDSVASYTRAVFSALAATGVPTIHFGTATAGLLPQMADAGGDVIGVDWRVELGDAWARIGYHRGIQGNLDPAVLLGPLEVVQQHARMVMEQAGGRPGHIFNLGHGVHPDTPREHLRWLVNLVHEYSGQQTRSAR